MAKYEAGFIGAGSMGGALAQAAVKTAGGGRVAVACSTPEHSEEAAARLGCAAETAETILWESRFVFLGAKQFFPFLFSCLRLKISYMDPAVFHA